MHTYIHAYIHACIHTCMHTYIHVELALRSGNVMDYHATARGLNPGRNGVFIELHVLRKGQ